MTTQYTIYRLPNYTISKNEDGQFNCESYTGTIEKVIKRLQKDKGYHLRINPNNSSIAYGDLDHIPSENIFNDIIKKLCDVFEVSTNQVSYTLSTKENELSYHWSIPCIESTPHTLKTILETDSFNNYRKYIDVSIYSSHWFRLPEQSNKNKPLKHTIINGKPEDFIIEYINNTTDNIIYEVEDKPDVKPSIKNDNSKIEEQIKNCLECLSIDDYNDFDKWRDIALIINNELGYNGFDILNEWSSNGNGYNKVKVELFYKNIKPKDNGLKIGSLKKMAKESNPDMYKQLFKNKSRCYRFIFTK